MQNGKHNGANNKTPNNDADDMDTEPNGGDPPFDENPAQRAENTRKRREIRTKLRHLIDKTNENSHDLVQGDTSGLMETLQSADEIFATIKNPREAVLDSHLMAVIGNLAKQRAQRFNTNLVTFEPMEYAIKIMSFISDDQRLEENVAISAQGWEKLGEAVQPFFKRSPPLQLMYGTFTHQPPERPERAPRRAKEVVDPNAKRTVPEKVKSFKNDKQVGREETTEQVDIIHKKLERYCYEQNNGDPLCYFEFIINPHSFSQTIENMFYVSFLINSGFAKIMLDADKLPLIAPTGKRKSQNGETEMETEEDTGQRNQVVMTMTMKEWKDIIRVFGITDPLIPTRQSQE